jgi:mitochondrial splicing suppressor protein 51
MTGTGPATHTCATCSRTRSIDGRPLQYCAKCHETQYCSRECQKADWKSHKKVCGGSAAPASSTSAGSSSNHSTFTSSATTPDPPKGLSGFIDKPFHRLDSRTWLHDRPKNDVYKLLIDVYRLRMNDSSVFDRVIDTDSIYGGAPHSQPSFRRFLRQVEGKPGLLPPWWSPEKATACENVGMNTNGWSSLAYAIEKKDVLKHYEDPSLPMQLRMFGEQVYGRAPGGGNSDSMRRIQMMTERGEISSRLVDISSFAGS